MATKEEAPSSSGWARNFTLSTAERVRAIAAGPPAWSLRLKRIDNLQRWLIAELGRLKKETGAWPSPVPMVVQNKLDELVELVRAHNAFFPIEADLPNDLATGKLIYGGAPWQPLAEPTIETLILSCEEATRRP